MNVGVGLPNTLSTAGRQELLGWARRADAGPFSSLAVLDRLRYDSYDPLVCLAAAVALTERITLATMVVAGPLRNTAVLAKTAASIGALSGGRFVLGLALGAREADYELAGLPYGERGRRFDEQLGRLRVLWEDAAIGPRAGAEAGPRLYIGGNSELTFERVARYADGYMHGGGPPHVLARMVEKVCSAWQDAGRPGRPEIWGTGYFALGGPEQFAAGAAYLRDYYGFTGPFAERIAQGLLTTPQAIRQFMRGYADAGCDELVLFPTVVGEEQLERLADVVA
jgi:alkanesulfonate monooxygenase SsuD/methylene tetrahydromethanopterin reductase-like flavin-dependent oxidoreductase (luciferase family)